MGVAVALDEPLTLGDLHGEIVIARARPDAHEPRLDTLLLEAIAQRAAAPAPQAREQIER